jgi:hypothetical protein
LDWITPYGEVKTKNGGAGVLDFQGVSWPVTTTVGAGYATISGSVGYPVGNSYGPYDEYVALTYVSVYYDYTILDSRIVSNPAAPVVVNVSGYLANGSSLGLSFVDVWECNPEFGIFCSEPFAYSYDLYGPTQLTISSVPELDTWMMMLLGLAAMSFNGHRRAFRKVLHGTATNHKETSLLWPAERADQLFIA